MTSVFNLLKECEQNKEYITFESLSNAGKALNLNLNEKEIKECFNTYDNEINIDKFKKLILDTSNDKKSYNMEFKRVLTTSTRFERKSMKHKTQ